MKAILRKHGFYAADVHIKHIVSKGLLEDAAAMLFFSQENITKTSLEKKVREILFEYGESGEYVIDGWETIDTRADRAFLENKVREKCALLFPEFYQFNLLEIVE